MTSSASSSKYSNYGSSYSSRKSSTCSDHSSASSMSPWIDHYFVPIKQDNNSEHGQASVQRKRISEHNQLNSTVGSGNCCRCRQRGHRRHCSRYDNPQSMLSGATTTFHEWEQLRVQSPSSVYSSIFELIQLIAPDSQQKREAYLRRFKEVPCHVIITCPHTCKT